MCGKTRCVSFVVVEPNKNILLGVAIMLGFVTFLVMDKTIRIASGGDGAHDHFHGHSHGKKDENTVAQATGLDKDPQSGSLRQRHGDKTAAETTTTITEQQKETNAANSNRGLLNAIADFTHNITDGLAMASSFYASPTVGALTTTAVFFHEVPHEVGDFALLIQSGYSKRAAIGTQFLTAGGALLGAIMGIAIQEFGGGNGVEAVNTPGLFGTSLHVGDLLLPWTAGSFLFVACSVVPELLETGEDKGAEIRKIVTQLVAMAAGAGIMIAYVYPCCLHFDLLTY